MRWGYVLNNTEDTHSFISPRLANIGLYAAVPGGIVEMGSTVVEVQPGQMLRVPWDVYMESVHRSLVENGRAIQVNAEDWAAAWDAYNGAKDAEIDALKAEIAELKKPKPAGKAKAENGKEGLQDQKGL